MFTGWAATGGGLMISLISAVSRGAWMVCPRCGGGPLFDSYALLAERCTSCNLPIRAREDDTWFFMYISTAGITGIFLLVMLSMTPRNLLVGRIAIALAAFAIFFATNRRRKGIAIGLDFYVDSRSEHPKHQG
jgi:uncharacterized protein (DUF983 family)